MAPLCFAGILTLLAVQLGHSASVYTLDRDTLSFLETEPSTPQETPANADFKFAVVRPFIEKDAQLLIEGMSAAMVAWKEACNKPRNNESPTDLIFYFNKDLDTKPQLKSQLEQLAFAAHVDKCFQNVKVVSANLPAELDGYPRGACNQFFRLFIDEQTRKLIGHYTSIFYMEPDVQPVRSGWLEQVRKEAQSAATAWYWVAGPTYDASYVPDEYKKNGPYFNNHLNGNSIYRYDDDAYLNFLRGSFNEAVNQCDTGDYDDKIWNYMTTSHPDFRSRFTATELVAHCKAGAFWDPVLSYSDVRAKYPNAYLMHALPLRDTTGKNINDPAKNLKLIGTNTTELDDKKSTKAKKGGEKTDAVVAAA